MDDLRKFVICTKTAIDLPKPVIWPILAAVHLHKLSQQSDRTSLFSNANRATEPACSPMPPAETACSYSHRL